MKNYTVMKMSTQLKLSTKWILSHMEFNFHEGFTKKIYWILVKDPEGKK